MTKDTWDSSGSTELFGRLNLRCVPSTALPHLFLQAATARGLVFVLDLNDCACPDCACPGPASLLAEVGCAAVPALSLLVDCDCGALVPSLRVGLPPPALLLVWCEPSSCQHRHQPTVRHSLGVVCPTCLGWVYCLGEDDRTHAEQARRTSLMHQR
eukprot:3554702-Rhodomonas_salina.2